MINPIQAIKYVQKLLLCQTGMTNYYRERCCVCFNGIFMQHLHYLAKGIVCSEFTKKSHCTNVSLIYYYILGGFKFYIIFIQYLISDYFI